MAAADLGKKIKLILSNIDDVRPIYVTQKQIPSPMTDPPFIVTDPNDVHMSHEQVGVLKTLYGQCSPEEKVLFISFLLGEMAERYVPVIVATLLHTDHLGELVSALSTKEGAWKSVEVRTLVWAVLQTTLAHEPHRFTEKDLTRLEAARHRDATSARIAEKNALLSRKRQLPRH